MKNVLTTGSQFSGYGSYLFALQSLGVDYKSKFCCDIDKFVKQTYLANHETENYYTDATGVDWTKAPYVDLFMSSPPCQSFSIAGKRKGEADSRGVLFAQTYEYIKAKRPRVFIIENVTGLLSIDNGGVLDSWLKHLAKFINGAGLQFSLFENQKDFNSCDYYVTYKTLNSKQIGYPGPIPQNRDRVFIVGFRDKEDYLNFKWPKRKQLKKALADLLDSEVEDKYFLSNKMVKVIFNTPAGTGFKPCIDGPVAACITANYGKMGRTNQFIKIDNKKFRRLTPNECRSLMGLPNNFKTPCSDSQKYKQFGNSIVVNVLAAIFKGIEFVK